MPTQSPGLKAVLSYYQSAVKVTSEGDTSMSDEAIQGLGTASSFLTSYLFGAITQIATPPVTRQDALPATYNISPQVTPEPLEHGLVTKTQEISRTSSKWSALTQFVPDPGYFLAGGLSGVASRTTTAPLDRLKVYLIAQTGTTQDAADAIKQGAPLKATKKSFSGLTNACRALWAAGGIRSLFAGMYRQLKMAILITNALR